MRHTSDNAIVQDNEPVFEIVLQYYNAEWCESVPRATIAMDVPVGIKIWVKEYNCKRQCKIENIKRRLAIDKMINDQK